jgi:hypothetical protein
MSPRSRTPRAAIYSAVYCTLPKGGWRGEVSVLGVSTTGPTLHDVRESLSKKVAAHLQGQVDAGVGLAKGIPAGATTVADRIDVTIFSMGRGGTKKLVTAHSEPSRVPGASPYLDKHGQHLLLESVVLVIDELGATSLMTSGLTEAAIRARATLLAKSREWLGEGETEALESIVVYTDNLVHGAPFADAEEATSRLGFTVSAAAHYQLELALAGTILRGGIAIGQHHQSDSIVVGPALIEAHILESAVAVYPRVLLSEDALRIVARGLGEWMRPEDSPWVAQLLVDEDEEVFVSYLDASGEYDRGRRDQILVLERHRDRVAAGIKSTQPGSNPRAKWEWAAAYHDYFVVTEDLPKALRLRKAKDWGRTFTSLAELLPKS